MVKFKVVAIELPAEQTDVFPTDASCTVKVVSLPALANVNVLVVKLTEANA